MMLLVPLLLVFIGLSLSQECTNPYGKGICMNITMCPSLMPQAKHEVEAFKQGCDIQDFVCCPDCFTPDGKSGVCKLINQCPHIDAMTEEEPSDYINRYLAYSLCPGRRNKYCCGPPPQRSAPVGDCASRVTALLPEPDNQCSGIDAVPDQRIMSRSTTVDVGMYPWLSALEYNVDGKILIQCVGALISGKYVLTSAYCVTKQEPVSVRLGAIDGESPGKACRDGFCPDAPISIPIQKIVTNDISLIRLMNMAPYTDYIRPINLPTYDLVIDRLDTERVLVASWNHNMSKKYSLVSFVNTIGCILAHSRVNGGNSPYITDRQICVVLKHQKDLCINGLLMLETTFEGKRVYELIGVKSSATQTCGHTPQIYYKVYAYLEWIRAWITI